MGRVDNEKITKKSINRIGCYNTECYKVTLLFDHTTTPNKKKIKKSYVLKSHELNINLNMFDVCVNILQNNIPLVNYMLYSEVYL